MIKQLLLILLNAKIEKETGRYLVSVNKFQKRVLKITNNPSATAKFTLGEIAGYLFNFDLALKNLTDKEFNNLMDVYEDYLRETGKIKFNLPLFQYCCFDIMANFNAVAPYEKICNFDMPDVIKKVQLYTKLNSFLKPDNK